ncbi:rod shape-determining protein MreD [Gammaproteobacteria bacterium]|nr:rod shape-determining protein MreD [Gammaproteobacteria bacterium]
MSSIPVVLSFLVAMMLTSLPLPESAIIYRPDWLILVLIYWCMALPERIGIFTGWFLGLTLDVMYGSLLGQNAMAFSIVAYLVNIMYLRVRMFPLWQQSVMVFLLVIVHLAINAWIRGISGQFSITWTYWMPALTSALVWPFLFVVLRDIRRQIIGK